MGIQLLTDVRKTNGQNLILTIIIKVFQSRVTQVGGDGWLIERVRE